MITEMFVDVGKVIHNSDFLQNLDKSRRKFSIKEGISLEDRGYIESDFHFEKSNGEWPSFFYNYCSY